MKPPISDTPGSRLRTARKARKLAQVDFAALIDYDRAHISSVETNRAPGGRAFWEKVAGALGVGIDHFLQRDSAAGDVAEGQQPVEAMPEPDPAEEISQFGEVATRAEALLKQEQMPADARSVGQLAAVMWRDLRNLRGTMSFEDRLALVVSERQNILQNARSSMFRSPLKPRQRR